MPPKRASRVTIRPAPEAPDGVADLSPMMAAAAPATITQTTSMRPVEEATPANSSDV